MAKGDFAVNSTDFHKVFEYRMKMVENTLFKKAAEYATDDDRLHNFHSAAGMTGQTPAQALWGFVVKHIISVQDIIKSGRVMTPAEANEKIGDIIAYMVLLEAVYMDGKRSA